MKRAGQKSVNNHGSVVGVAGSSSVKVLLWSGSWRLNNHFIEILENRTE